MKHFDSLVSLIVADKLKDLMFSEVSEYDAEHEGIETLSPVKLAERAERYIVKIRERSVRNNAHKNT